MGNPLFYRYICGVKKVDYVERFVLARDRIKELATGQDEIIQPAGYKEYFTACFEFYHYLLESDYKIHEDFCLQTATFEQLREMHDELYSRQQPEVYSYSFFNPAYAVRRLGAECGGVLSMVYATLQNAIVAIYESRIEIICIYGELLLQIYGCFVDEYIENEKPESYSEDSLKYLSKSVRDIIYWFFHDYTEIFEYDIVHRQVDPSYNYIRNKILSSDLSNNRYLYTIGLHVGKNEVELADFMRTLSDDQVKAMARTYTEGYKKGFEAAGIDLSKKKTVQIHAPLGFERVTREAIKQFKEMGLESTVCVGKAQRNLYSTSVNRQYDYDHKDDRAYYLDKSFVERRLEARREAFERHKRITKLHAGPAVIEVFGQEPFAPINKPENPKLSQKQNELAVYEMSKLSQMTNAYIPGDERSFTIIAYPLPEIGPQFEAIFDKTVEVNTLNYELYQDMQQRIIDILDTGYAVHITGRNQNKTDITVMLHPLEDPSKQTIFENCVADVNIPVGEVFTSPVLEGTQGTLYVSQVYLNQLSFKDLCLEFKDGKITSYSCSNFDSEQENLDYIKDNVLFRHETLPIGEFAIGTNTVAYRMARDFDIADKLPILIAEKTGPHFAVGDTCYSHAEDNPIYNSDGKECIARDNSISIIRNEDPLKAYFNCHTDITIPYDELGDIIVLREDGSQAYIIKDGRFVVEGTELLNEPLDN